MAKNDQADADEMSKSIGDESVVFGSSYPDADSSFPLAVANFRALENIAETSKRKILSDNAARLLGLQ